VPKILVKRIGRGRAPRWGPEVVKEIKRKMDDQVKPDLLKLFREVVADWDTKIQFGAKKVFKGDELVVFVFPKGKNKLIWRYVSFGTKPHKIEAKNAPMLVFPWGGPGSYQPRTRPVGKFGEPGTVRNAKIVAFRSVQHPGTEARLFEQAIARRYRPKFDRIMAKAIVRGISNARIKAKSAR